jgi:excisionase family DNA binding protein
MEAVMEVPNPQQQPLMKPTEVAALLGVSLSNVYRMIRLGDLPTIRLGGGKSTRIVTAELRRKVLGLDEPTAI